MSTSKGRERIQIIKQDMNEQMQTEAFDVAVMYINKFQDSQRIAIEVKQYFDKHFNFTWHCIVGEKFGTSVRYEEGHFIYFYVGSIAILLFKCG